MRRKHLIRKLKNEFVCQRCNECCKQEGFVFLTSKDISRIAAHLKMDEAAFMKTYGAETDGSRVLQDKPGTDHCIFLDEDKGCTINSVKPQQCLDYPMKWRDPESFEYCEGIKKLAEEACK